LWKSSDRDKRCIKIKPAWRKVPCRLVVYEKRKGKSGAAQILGGGEARPPIPPVQTPLTNDHGRLTDARMVERARLVQWVSELVVNQLAGRFVMRGNYSQTGSHKAAAAVYRGDGISAVYSDVH